MSSTERRRRAARCCLYIEIDNNLVENAIRPTALGKKNWLFFGDAKAGERSAVIYSIIESCRRHGVEPYSYLRDVLTRLPSMTNRQIKDITPKAWATANGSGAKFKFRPDLAGESLPFS